MSLAAYRTMIGSVCLLAGLSIASSIPIAALLFAIPLSRHWAVVVAALGLGCGWVIRAVVLGQLDGLQRAQEAERLRFHTAINNITQGLCFFDGSRRLIVCNDRYAELYKLTREQVRPGTTLEEIVDHRFATGCFPSMSQEDYLRWRERIVIADQPSNTIVELKDGRTFAIHHQPMPDNGWVATHTDITEQCRAQAEIERLARLDALTGLANRRIFHETLEQALAARSDEVAPVAILYVDLDRFKEVNDTFGHPVGDLLIRGVAERLMRCGSEALLPARIGGDEFAIIQTGAAQPDGSMALAQRLISDLETPFQLDGHRVVVGASVGIAIAGCDSGKADELLKAADLALYDAKSRNRGSYSLYRPELQAIAEARRVASRLPAMTRSRKVAG